MAREAWEEVSFQVFTDENGVLRSGLYPTGAGTVTGNVAVDFVWGNVPMQPDDDRTGQTIEIGGGPLDIGWYPTYKFTSEELGTSYAVLVGNQAAGFYSEVGTNHTVATTGWSNFPGYIPNYEGDEDPELEVVVPNFVRKTLSEGEALAEKLGLQLNTFAHTLTINYILWTGNTVRISAYDTDVSNWSDSHGSAYLIGLKKGDQVSLSITGDNFGPFDFSPYQTVTKVHLDGENSWFEFEVAEANEFDEIATGTVYAGPNLENVITTQRSNVSAGTIVDEGRNINVRYFQF